MYGAAVYFDADRYLWTSVNGVGVDPGVSGTGHEVALSGSAPFSAEAWATAAESVIGGLGYSVSRSTAELEVTVASSSRASTAESNQSGLETFDSRGGGGVFGSLQMAAAASFNAGGQGWCQVDPALVPSGPFRVVALGVRRGSNVSGGVRVALGQGGAGNGDPEGLTVDEDRTMGNSGVNAWHYEMLDTPVEYSGGERLWLGSHGDGTSASSIFAGGAIDDGFYASGSNNMWTTDGTTGPSTPTVSPAGPVTNSYNYGLALRAIIQEAPYQADGGYRVICGAIPGLHDGDLYAPGTPVNDIFVSWRFTPPSIDDIYLMDFGVRLQAHDADATPVEGTESRLVAETSQQGEGEEMEELRERQGASRPDLYRQGVETFLTVEVVVLAGVDDVKSGGPEGDGQSQQDGKEIQFGANRDPGSNRGESQGGSEYKVGEGGEPLGEGISQHNSDGDRAEIEGQGVDRPAADGEKAAGHDGRPQHEATRQLTGWQGA